MRAFQLACQMKLGENERLFRRDRAIHYCDGAARNTNKFTGLVANFDFPDRVGTAPVEDGSLAGYEALPFASDVVGVLFSGCITRPCSFCSVTVQGKLS